jgi:16S rRNA (cytosine967-C5)-methyltransferase
LAELQARQAAILTGAARLVKPGGRLLYATCSLLRAENERLAEAFSSEQAVAFEPEPVRGLLEAARVPTAADLVTDAHLRLWPDRHGTDGFFAAAWRRR